MPPAPAPIPAGRLACRSPDRRANSRLWAHLSRHARGFREPLRSRAQGEIAQLVEHTTENRGVLGSIPSLATHESTATLHLSGRARSPPRSVSSAPRSSQYDAEAVARFPNPCTSGTRVGRASQRPACVVLSQLPLGVCCGQPPFRHRAGEGPPSPGAQLVAIWRSPGVAGVASSVRVGAGIRAHPFCREVRQPSA